MYRGPSGLLIASATNTPRIEYGSGGEVLGLLMEASRTNIGLQSQTFDNATWVKSEVTVTANQTVSPDGTSNADQSLESANNAPHRPTQDITVVSGTTYTCSLWLKDIGRRYFQIALGTGGFAANAHAFFDLTSAVVVSTGAGATSSRIESYANGWFRCSVTAAATISASATVFLNHSIDGVSTSYTGDVTKGFYLYGFQFEAGTFPSSYIPTTTVSVARTADSCIRTLSTEFSATSGTVVVAGRASPGQDATNAQTVFDFNDATGANRIAVLRTAAGDTARYTMLNTSAQQGPLDGTFVNSTNYKAAIAFASNDLAYSFNGAAVTTDATATIPTITKLELGSATVGGVQGNCHIRTFDYFPTRQPNEWLVSRAT